MTTVRRWEKREGLPVHRHLHAQRDSVYADKTDLDTWWQGRPYHLGNNGGVEGAPEAPQPAPWLSGARLPWVLAATVVAVSGILATVLAGGDRSGALRDKPQIRFSVLPPADTGFGSVSVSPDGRRLAFTAAPVSGGGRALLWIRPLDALTAHALPDTDDATFPFWSPASDAVGFFAGGKLWGGGGPTGPSCITSARTGA